MCGMLAAQGTGLPDERSAILSCRPTPPASDPATNMATEKFLSSALSSQGCTQNSDLIDSPIDYCQKVNVPSCQECSTMSLQHLWALAFWCAV